MTDALTKTARKDEAVMATVARIKAQMVDAFNMAVIRGEATERQVCEKMECSTREFRNFLLRDGNFDLVMIPLFYWALGMHADFRFVDLKDKS